MNKHVRVLPPLRVRSVFVLYLVLSSIIGGCALLVPSQHRTEEYTEVFAAAAGGDLLAMQRYIASDPSLISAREWSNQTLLHAAVGQNQADMAKYLLSKGADVNAVTSDGLTPLHMAAQNGNIEIIRLLLDHGATINAVDGKGWTPLDRAEKWGHSDTADFLRARGGRTGTAAELLRPAIQFAVN